jgi:hypothetical protein
MSIAVIAGAAAAAAGSRRHYSSRRYSAPARSYTPYGNREEPKYQEPPKLPENPLLHAYVCTCDRCHMLRDEEAEGLEAMLKEE